MKKRSGFNLFIVIVIIVVVGLLGLATYKVIDDTSKMTDYDQYDFNSVIEPTADNGYIGDHYKGGNPATATVLIFEYADYQCPGCAAINPKVNEALANLDGQVVLVYRSMLLSYHQNGTAAASAAEAAGLQGYWKAFANLLFSEQDEWEYADASERTEYFNSYFETVTNGEGDLEKFNEDIASTNVSKKISFDMGISKRIEVSATPAFYVDGQNIVWNKAGSITINDQTITWDGSLGDTESLTKFFQQLVNAKTGKTVEPIITVDESEE